MENSTLEGDAPKTPVEIVAEILPKTTFLRNARLESKGRSTTAATTATAARVEELEDELDAERQTGLDLRDKVERLMKQVEDSEAARLKQVEEAEMARLKQVEEAEAARLKQVEEMDNLKKASEDTQALLHRLLELNKVGLA
ncbi:hypothetical protein QOZ80_4BG0343780 [Eleusine coracana subsp. coracana]|nr:hypothetical protein QOZ80_4BG0343780 [Eleusine coracana subsp. coracana]